MIKLEELSHWNLDEDKLKELKSFLDEVAYLHCAENVETVLGFLPNGDLIYRIGIKKE